MRERMRLIHASAHARQNHGQQQIHGQLEARLVLGNAVYGHEVLEKYVSLQRHPPQAEIGDGFYPAHRYEQQPAQRQRRVHVAQNGVDAEYPYVQQRLAHDLPQGGEALKG